jgi:hypothetical protein
MNPEDNTPWQYKPDNGSTPSGETAAGGSAQPQSSSPAQSVSWQAPEFIYHPHGPGWYAVLVLSTLALATIAYLAAKDLVATVTLAILGVIVGIFAAQKPSNADYEVGDSGISINSKLYNYGNYKSFSLVHEGPLSSVNLFPLKRFMPPLALYFPPSEEQKVVSALGNYLPFDSRKLDTIDRLSRRLRL